MHDPLTIAFIAIGVNNALRNADGLPTTFQGGQLEFVDEIITYSNEIELLCPNDWGGVFCYDVAEPFGELFAEQWILTGVKPDVAVIARQIFEGAK